MKVLDLSLLKTNIEKSTAFPAHRWDVSASNKAAVETRNLFAVVSYNLLADAWNGTGPLFASRGERIVREILSVAPDVVCLQEVDGAAVDYVRRALQMEGPHAVNESGEGVAVLLNSRRFEIQTSGSIAFPLLACEVKEEESSDATTIMGRVCRKMESIRHHSRAAYAVAKDLCCGGNDVLFVSTHLYWGFARPEENFQMQLFQAHLLMRKIVTLAPATPLVLCGDLNASVCSPLFRYFAGERIDDDLLRFGMPSHLKCEALQSPLPLRPAYELGRGEREATFYTDFMDVLDHIFVTPSFNVVKHLALPNRGELIKSGPCPNEVYPSDHLMVGAQLALL